MKRALSIFLTCVFLLGLLPTAALAAEPDSGGLCPHHQKHSFEDCGFIEAVEGQPCGHVHDGDCGFVEAAEEIPCDMDCNGTGEDGQIVHAEDCAYVPEVEGVPCQHEHDGECGYVPADPGQPHGFVCRICPVQALIDALPAPEDITPGNRAEVEAQLAAIDEVRLELTDEEIAALDITRYAAAISALAALDGQTGNELPAPLADGTGNFNVTGGALNTDYSYADNTLTIKSDTNLIISGSTTTDKIVIEDGVAANVTLQNVSIDVSGTDNACAFEVAGSASCALTLTGTNTLKSGHEKAGLQVLTTASLTITAASSGSLNATGGEYAAGIGGVWNGTGGNITIDGGNVTANGGACSAGIGGGRNGTGGNITINGGIINASAPSSTGDPAAIGGGGNGNAGTIVINGGVITAQGCGKGIGNGARKTGGTITIYSGTVSANGIGTGGYQESAVTTILGGVVICTNTGNGGINKTNQGNWSGVVFEGDEGKVYGSPELKEDATIPNGKTLTIENGKTLTIASGVTLTNNGTIQIDQGGTLKNNGTLTGNGTFTGGGEITGTKLTQAVPGAGEGYTIDCTTEQITIESGYQVSSDKSDTIADGPIDPGKQLYVRKEGNNFYDASGWTNFTAPSRETTPSVSIDYVEEELNTTAAMQYVIGTSGHGDMLPKRQTGK